MKRNKRRHFLVPILLVAAMVVSVTGCGEKFDASRYVKGCLDASTKGVFEDYVAMTNTTEEQAKKEYEERMNSEVEAMTGSISMSEEMQEKYRTLYKDIYSKYKYEVGEAKEGENDSFTVPVKTYRLKIFEKTMEETQTKVEEEVKKNKSASTEETMQLYLETLANVLTEKLQNPEYGEEETIEVNLSVNSSSNEYEMSSADVTKLFAALDDVGQAQ